MLTDPGEIPVENQMEAVLGGKGAPPPSTVVYQGLSVRLNFSFVPGPQNAQRRIQAYLSPAVYAPGIRRLV